MRVIASIVASLSLLLCGHLASASGNMIPARVAEALSPPLKYVRFVGNTIRARHLQKRLDFKAGSRANPALVEAGRIKLEKYYRSKGFDRVRVLIAEGAKAGDMGVVYVIKEGVR